MESTLKKIGTLGGSIHVNPNLKNMYFGENTSGGPMSKERLFGQHGPLLMGMPNPESRHEEIALSANVFDTKSDLIREITESSELTRPQAEALVKRMLSSGQLAEIDFEGRRVLVWGGQPK